MRVTFRCERSSGVLPCVREISDFSSHHAALSRIWRERKILLTPTAKRAAVPPDRANAFRCDCCRSRTNYQRLVAPNTELTALAGAWSLQRKPETTCGRWPAAGG